jgi:hypothetical protein
MCSCLFMMASQRKTEEQTKLSEEKYLEACAIFIKSASVGAINDGVGGRLPVNQTPRTRALTFGGLAYVIHCCVGADGKRKTRKVSVRGVCCWCADNFESRASAAAATNPGAQPALPPVSIGAQYIDRFCLASRVA